MRTFNLLRDRSVVDREPHKLVVAGSIPAPATIPGGGPPFIFAGDTPARFQPVGGGRFTRWAVRLLGWNAQRRRSLAEVVPVSNDLSEPPVFIPPGALAGLNPQLLALTGERRTV